MNHVSSVLLITILACGRQKDEDSAVSPDLLIPVFEMAPALSTLWIGRSSAVADFDGDGNLDIVGAAEEGYPDGAAQVVAYKGAGDGTFEEVTEAWGLASTDESWGTLAFDLEGDGDMDLIITKAASGGENTLHINDGTGSFTQGEMPDHPCLWSETHGIATADLDLDGDLDVVLANGMVNQFGECTDVLLNDGTGVFTNADVNAAEYLKQACGVALADLDGDMYPDMLLGELGPNPVIHFNTGTPDIFDFADPDENREFDVARSMTIEPFDYDQDGDIDFIISDIEQQAMYRNDGNRNFTNVTVEAGLTGIDLIMDLRTADVDSNGYPDIYFAHELHETKLVTLMMNNGDGTFTDGTVATGLRGAGVELVHGSSFVDINKDSMLDIVVNRGGLEPGTEGGIEIYLNRGPVFKNLRVGIGGYAANSEAVGTKVEVVTDLGSRFAWVRRGDHMGSTSADDLLVGLGEATTIEDVIATYPDGVVVKSGPLQMSDHGQIEIEYP